MILRKLIILIELIFINFHLIFCQDCDTTTWFIENNRYDNIKCFDNNGNKVIEYNLKNKKFHGQYKSFYQNGNVRDIETYYDGLLNGESLCFYENGSKMSKRYYFNDIEDSIWISWYENGLLNSQYKYLKYKQDSLLLNKKELIYDPVLSNDSNTQLYFIYKNPRRDGEWTEFYINNQLKSYKKFDDGIKTGIWLYWDINGVLLRKEVYYNDKLIEIVNH